MDFHSFISFILFPHATEKKKNFINIFHLIVWFVSVFFFSFFTWIYILIILCLQFALQLITPYMLDAKQFFLFMVVYNIYSISRAPSSTTRLVLRLFIFCILSCKVVVIIIIYIVFTVVMCPNIYVKLIFCLFLSSSCDLQWCATWCDL